MAAVEDLSVPLALSELAQELERKRLLGPQSRLPLMNRLWQELLPALEQQAPVPVALAEALSNALYHLCLRPAARPEAWLQHLLTGRLTCHQSQELLDLSVVAAWLAGLPELRANALQKLAGFPDLRLESLFLGRFSASELRLGLNSSPWWHPDHSPPPGTGAAELRLCHVLGAFRGWGGPFLLPPQLSGKDGACFVSSGTDHWQLQADAFGWLLKRCNHLPVPQQPAQPWPAREAFWQGLKCLAPAELPNPICGLAGSDFLALASTQSFQICVLASEAHTETPA